MSIDSRALGPLSVVGPEASHWGEKFSGLLFDPDWVVQAQASSGASLAALILFETLGLCGWLDPASSQRTFLPRPELAKDLTVEDSTTMR